MVQHNQIKEAVKNAYAKAVDTGCGCSCNCSQSSNEDLAKSIGYSDKEISERQYKGFPVENLKLVAHKK